MANSDIFCLDPSCFTTLEELINTTQFLNEIKKYDQIEVYVPTRIYETINLPPEEKFKKLPSLIGDWIDIQEYDNIVAIRDNEKEEYVHAMQNLLRSFAPLPVNKLIGNIEKIGEESLHLHKLKEQFGKFCGEILFEMAAISNECSAKILAFGEKTISFFTRIGSRIEKGASRVKKQIKKKARIRTPMNIMMYFFVPSPAVITFIQEFQIQGLQALLDPKFAAISLPLGWFIVANS